MSLIGYCGSISIDFCHTPLFRLVYSGSVRSWYGYAIRTLRSSELVRGLDLYPPMSCHLAIPLKIRIAEDVGKLQSMGIGIRILGSLLLDSLMNFPNGREPPHGFDGSPMGLDYAKEEKV